jgi:hypothetical protein
MKRFVGKYLHKPWLPDQVAGVVLGKVDLKKKVTVDDLSAFMTDISAGEEPQSLCADSHGFFFFQFHLGGGTKKKRKRKALLGMLC